MVVLTLLAVACTPATEPSSVVSASASTASPGATSAGLAVFPGAGNGGYDVERYEWAFDVSDDLTSLDAVATTKAVATQPLSRFTLDYAGPPISSVTLNGGPVRYEQAGGELTVIPDRPLADGVAFTVTVDYQGAPPPFTQPDLPFPMGWTVTSGPTALVHGVPGASATWVPLHDDPSERAAYRLSFDVPEPYTVTASGVQDHATSDPDAGVSVWTSGDTELSSIGFSIAEYERLDFVGPRELPIDVHLQLDHAVEAQPYTELPEVVTWLESLFGPFPYEAVGVSDIGTVAFTAVSAPGRVLLSGSPTPSLLVHELAHQWIGNSVTAGPSDIWLMEGLPQYLELVWHEQHGGDPTATDEQMRARLAGLGDDTRPPADVSTIRDLVDVVAYERGAATVHALRLDLGDGAFFEVLRRFAEQYAHRHTSTADFIALAEDTSGRDLGPFFEAWLNQRPVLDLPTPSG